MSESPSNVTLFTNIGDLTLQRAEAQVFGTATAVAGAASLNTYAGKVTTEALTTAAGLDYTLTLTNEAISADDVVLVSIGNASNTGGSPLPGAVTPGAGSVSIVVQNGSATVAFNGTLQIGFRVQKA